MSWLGPLPFDVPGFPGLTGATLLWLAAFLASTLYVVPLALGAWRSYAVLRGDPDLQAERLYALGQAIARTCGVLMILAGLVAGFISAATPPVLPRRPFTISTYAFVSALLILAVLITIQSVALQVSQRAAEAVLRARPAADSVGRQLAEALKQLADSRGLLETIHHDTNSLFAATREELKDTKEKVVDLQAEIVQLREALKLANTTTEGERTP